MIALSTMSTIPFGNIIRLAEVMSLTAPNLSQRNRTGVKGYMEPAHSPFGLVGQIARDTAGVWTTSCAV